MNVELRHVFNGHVGANYSLCNGLESHLFYSGSADRFVGSWDIKTGKLIGPLVRGSSSIYSLWLDDKNSTLYIGQRQGTVLIVDLKKEQGPRSIQAHNSDIFSVVLNEHGHIITGGGDGRVKIWNQEDFKLLYDLYISTKSVRCVHLSPNKDEFFIGGSDHSIRVFNAKDMTEKQTLTGHTNSVFTIQSIGTDRLVTSGRDAIFIVWRKKNNEWVLDKRVAAHLYTVNHITLSPNGRLLASASRDKTIKIWDAYTFELLKVIDNKKYPEGHSHSVNRLLWKSNNILISTGDGRKVISWNITY